MQQPDVLSGLMTRDPELLRVCRTIERVGVTDATVLLLGESGTGKELLARGVHESSPRRRERFVAINCAAIPETCWKASSSATRRERSPAPPRPLRARSKRPTTAR
jgi:transcriptional regulator with PAS, ATPase and Fis domain